MKRVYESFYYSDSVAAKKYFSRIIYKQPSNLVMAFAEFRRRNPEEFQVFLKKHEGFQWAENKLAKSNGKNAHLTVSALKLFMNSCDALKS